LGLNFWLYFARELLRLFFARLLFLGAERRKFLNKIKR